MPTYSTGVTILMGDWVRVMSPRGVWHHGIVRRLIPLLTGGVAVQIAHNMKLTGVIVSDWYEFSDNREVFLHRRGLAAQVPDILSRVDASMGKTYNLIAQNCEHFASYAFTGNARSEAVQGAGVLAAVVVLCLLA